MSKQSFTKGQFEIRNGYGPLMAEIGTKDRAVATVWVKQPTVIDGKSVPVAWPEGEANARLFSTAPEMYMAIKAMINCAKAGNMEKGAQILSLMEEVIAKVEG